MRKVSTLAFIATVALPLAEAPETIGFGVLVIAILSFPFLLWDYICPRQTRKQALEDMFAVQSLKQCSS